jgi:hypothetical protein
LRLCYNAGMDAGDFQFVILKADWHRLGRHYDAEGALPLLQAASPEDVLYAIDLDGVDAFHWTRQQLILTPDATERLTQAVDEATATAAPLHTRLTALKARLGWGSALERALYIKGFRVHLRGEFLYGGIFLDAPSQMAISYPVARLAPMGEQAVISILPIHIPFVAYDPAAEGESLPAEALAPEVQPEWEHMPPGLRSAVRGWATGPTAEGFRARLHDPRLRELLAAAGKLQA